jgi:hypothetical protein
MLLGELRTYYSVQKLRTHTHTHTHVLNFCLLLFVFVEKYKMHLMRLGFYGMLPCLSYPEKTAVFWHTSL